MKRRGLRPTSIGSWGPLLVAAVALLDAHTTEAARPRRPDSEKAGPRRPDGSGETRHRRPQRAAESALERAARLHAEAERLDPKGHPGLESSEEMGEWRQIMSVPRVGGRLWSITVDPRDPERIYVGTEAGSVFLTDDGGASWLEVDVDARQVQRRSSGLPPPSLPQLSGGPQSISVRVSTPFSRRLRAGLGSVAGPFANLAAGLSPSLNTGSANPSVNLLSNILRSRRAETQPIERIVVCPGGRYEIVVASSDEVYGSTDDGLTYVRLFANPGKVFIDGVQCNPRDPNQIAVASNLGLFVSNDGGLSFDQDLSARPGRRSTAVAYGFGSGETRLYSAASWKVYAGNPATGLHAVYPNTAETAPWGTIRWIVADEEAVFLATDDGARVSYDHGQNWSVVARTLLSRQAIREVEIGESPFGKRRIAMMIDARPTASSPLQDALVYASDDGGHTFFPFFSGLTMRSMRQMSALPATDSHPAGWWIATSGEVWTNYPRAPSITVDPASVSWARRRLASSPSLAEVIGSVLDRTRLEVEDIEDLGGRLAALGAIPRLELSYQASTIDAARGPIVCVDPRVPCAPGLRDVFIQAFPQRSGQPYQALLLQLSWDTSALSLGPSDLGSRRRQLHRLRKQVELVAQDAYHERANLLDQMASGLSDNVAIETIRARILVLETILSTWMRAPLPGTSPKES